MKKLVAGTRAILTARIYEINVQDLLAFETIMGLQAAVLTCQDAEMVGFDKGVFTLSFPAKMTDGAVRSQIASAFERWDGTYTPEVLHPAMPPTNLSVNPEVKDSG